MFGSAATDFPGQAGASKCAFLKDGDGALGEICELAERFDNRLTLNNLRLAERYIDGTLNLLVEARWGAMGRCLRAPSCRHGRRRSGRRLPGAH